MYGQNTAYFFKFDVVGNKILKSGESQSIETSSLCFKHQYMTNLQDPYGQSTSVYNAYAKNGTLDGNINFIIPIYNNMPNSSNKPTALGNGDGELYYVDVKSSLNVRSSASTSASILTSLYKDDIVAILEKNVNGSVFYKIKTANGTVGYASSNYLKPCNNSANVSVASVSIDKLEISLQVGNGAYVTTSNLTAIVSPSNASNQNVTWKSSNEAVAKVNGGNVTAVGAGEATITVTTADGGKTARTKVTVINVDNTSYEIAYVNATTLNIRKEPTTSANIIGTVSKDEQVTIVQKDVKNDGTYIWYKIQLQNGSIGYIASNYLILIDKVKIDEQSKTISAIPSVTGSTMANTLGVTNYEVLNLSGQKVDNNSLVGTGYKFKNKNNGKEYIIIKKGDVNGDGKVDEVDALKILRYSVGQVTMSSDDKEAADVNNDGSISEVDALRILTYSVGKINISV